MRSVFGESTSIDVFLIAEQSRTLNEFFFFITFYLEERGDVHVQFAQKTNGRDARRNYSGLVMYQ